MLRKIAVFCALAAIGTILILTVLEMPSFGDISNPANNEVSSRYIEEAGTDTGAVNAVTGIIMDYRAFDTLGEATVLFTAIAAAVSTLAALSLKKNGTAFQEGRHGDE